MATAPRRLTKLRIDEVSSVDRGAGKGVQVMLMKRDGDEIDWSEVRKALTPDLDKSLKDAALALAKAISTITADTKLEDKAGAIAKATQDHNEHVADLIKKAGEQQENDDMSAELKKQLEEAQAALAKKDAEIEAAKLDAAIAKMSPEAQALVAKMSPEDKKKFAAKSKEEQDKECATAKRDAQITLPADIQKKLEQADENDKILKSMLVEKRAEEFKKRAVGMGLAEADGELLQKAYGGDLDAQKKLDEKIAGLVKQANSGALFDEFGKVGGGKTGDTAYDELVGKAAELRKTDAGKNLSPAQAFDKVFTDPANASIVKRMKDEEATKRNRVAA